jgi:hypothetical protein
MGQKSESRENDNYGTDVSIWGKIGDFVRSPAAAIAEAGQFWQEIWRYSMENSMGFPKKC